MKTYAIKDSKGNIELDSIGTSEEKSWTKLSKNGRTKDSLLDAEFICVSIKITEE